MPAGTLVLSVSRATGLPLSLPPDAPLEMALGDGAAVPLVGPAASLTGSIEVPWWCDDDSDVASSDLLVSLSATLPFGASSMRRRSVQLGRGALELHSSRALLSGAVAALTVRLGKSLQLNCTVRFYQHAPRLLGKPSAAAATSVLGAVVLHVVVATDLDIPTIDSSRPRRANLPQRQPKCYALVDLRPLLDSGGGEALPPLVPISTQPALLHAGQEGGASRPLQTVAWRQVLAFPHVAAVLRSGSAEDLAAAKGQALAAGFAWADDLELLVSLVDGASHASVAFAACSLGDLLRRDESGPGASWLTLTRLPPSRLRNSAETAETAEGVGRILVCAVPGGVLEFPQENTIDALGEFPTNPVRHALRQRRPEDSYLSAKAPPATTRGNSPATSAHGANRGGNFGSSSRPSFSSPPSPDSPLPPPLAFCPSSLALQSATGASRLPPEALRPPTRYSFEGQLFARFAALPGGGGSGAPWGHAKSSSGSALEGPRVNPREPTWLTMAGFQRLCAVALPRVVDLDFPRWTVQSDSGEDGERTTGHRAVFRSPGIRVLRRLALPRRCGDDEALAANLTLRKTDPNDEAVLLCDVVASKDPHRYTLDDEAVASIERLLAGCHALREQLDGTRSAATADPGAIDSDQELLGDTAADAVIHPIVTGPPFRGIRKRKLDMGSLRVPWFKFLHWWTNDIPAGAKAPFMQERSAEMIRDLDSVMEVIGGARGSGGLVREVQLALENVNMADRSKWRAKVAKDSDQLRRELCMRVWDGTAERLAESLSSACSWLQSILTEHDAHSQSSGADMVTHAAEARSSLSPLTEERSSLIAACALLDVERDERAIDGVLSALSELLTELTDQVLNQFAATPQLGERGGMHGSYPGFAKPGYPLPNALAESSSERPLAVLKELGKFFKFVSALHRAHRLRRTSRLEKAAVKNNAANKSDCIPRSGEVLGVPEVPAVACERSHVRDEFNLFGDKKFIEELLLSLTPAYPLAARSLTTDLHSAPRLPASALPTELPSEIVAAPGSVIAQIDDISPLHSSEAESRLARIEEVLAKAPDEIKIGDQALRWCLGPQSTLVLRCLSGAIERVPSDEHGNLVDLSASIRSIWGHEHRGNEHFFDARGLVNMHTVQSRPIDSFYLRSFKLEARSRMRQVPLSDVMAPVLTTKKSIKVMPGAAASALEGETLPEDSHGAIIAAVINELVDNVAGCPRAVVSNVLGEVIDKVIVLRRKQGDEAAAVIGDAVSGGTVPSLLQDVGGSHPQETVDSCVKSVRAFQSSSFCAPHDALPPILLLLSFIFSGHNDIHDLKGSSSIPMEILAALAAYKSTLAPHDHNEEVALVEQGADNAVRNLLVELIEDVIARSIASTSSEHECTPRAGTNEAPITGAREEPHGSGLSSDSNESLLHGAVPDGSTIAIGSIRALPETESNGNKEQSSGRGSDDVSKSLATVAAVTQGHEDSAAFTTAAQGHEDPAAAATVDQGHKDPAVEIAAAETIVPGKGLEGPRTEDAVVVATDVAAAATGDEFIKSGDLGDAEKIGSASGGASDLAQQAAMLKAQRDEELEAKKAATEMLLTEK